MDARDAQIEQLRARNADLIRRLDEAQHLQMAHGAIPAQAALEEMNLMRERVMVELRALINVVADAGPVCDREAAAHAFGLVLSRHVVKVQALLREIESANGQAGLCRHQGPLRVSVGPLVKQARHLTVVLPAKAEG